jgi:nitrite reductase/ring-hydroxylating ferredoxin subunit
MNQLLGKIYKTVLFCFFILIGTNGCKDDYTSVVPYVYVNFDFNPTNYIELNIPGGFVYFKNAGFGGIIVFHDIDDTFLAFDAACTHEISSTCRVVADGSGLATCPCCKSQFILFGGNGSPTKGPAIEPLKQYRASYTAGRIIIRN